MPLKFDVSEDDDASAQLKARYKAGTLPSVVYVAADRREVGRVDHMMEPDELAGVLGPAIVRLRSASPLASGEPCR